ncbi:MAG: polysaccharide deacetylase family protein [Ruminococcus sp.]|jgi:peptidoglycan/xylan/chitin deacetylase (PgdA/CDA1 family)|nr:polysaccharide deacetylase family protein [Ruminococcus sp.]
MKKLKGAIIALILTAALAGCGGTTPAAATTTTAATAATEVTTTMATTTTTAATTTAPPETTTEATTTTVISYSPIVREEIDPEKPIIALTFDDGPTDLTPQILDILEEKQVVASFFLIGDNINDDTAQYVIREFEQGHEVDNHSKTHSQMPEMTFDEIAAEIQYTSDKVEELIGIPTPFFRPPYIATNDVMYEAIDIPFITGYLPNDYMDTVDVEQRIENVKKSAKDGLVILLHDFSGNVMTVEALPTIIDNLKAEGYQFVTVSELFEVKGKTPEEGKAYTIVL